MITNRIFAIGLTLLGLIFYNCAQTEDPIECPAQFTGELQEIETKLTGKWGLVALVSDTEVDLTNDSINNPDFDMFAQSSECAKDATFNFFENRTYVYEVGYRVEGCARNNTTGTWKLDINDLFLVVACGSLTSEVSFNESNSRFEYTNSVDIQEVNGLVTRANVTYTFEKVEVEP